MTDEIYCPYGEDKTYHGSMARANKLFKLLGAVFYAKEDGGLTLSATEADLLIESLEDHALRLMVATGQVEEIKAVMAEAKEVLGYLE